jgi:hypothetical protein
MDATCEWSEQCARCRTMRRARQCGRCMCGGGLRFVKTADTITPSVPINTGRHGCGSLSCTVCARPAGIPCPTHCCTSNSAGYPSWWPTGSAADDSPPRLLKSRFLDVDRTLQSELNLDISDEEWEREKLTAKLRLGEGRRWGPTPAGPSIASAGCGVGAGRSCGDERHQRLAGVPVIVAPLRRPYTSAAPATDLMCEVDAFLSRNHLTV